MVVNFYKQWREFQTHGNRRDTDHLSRGVLRLQMLVHSFDHALDRHGDCEVVSVRLCRGKKRCTKEETKMGAAERRLIVRSVSSLCAAV